MICLISSQDIIGYRCVCVYKQTCLRLIILYITQDVTLQAHKDGCCAVSGLQIHMQDAWRVREFLAPHPASPDSTPYLPPRAMPSRRPHPSRVPLTDALLFRHTLTIFGTIKLWMSEGTSEISKSYPLVEHVNTKSLALRCSSTPSYFPTSGTV